MCGLFGAITNGWLSEDEKRNVRMLAHMSQLRGTDSTGIVTAARKNNKIKFHTVKKVLEASAFLQQPEVQATFNQKKMSFIAGHTRLATCGAVNEVNAHPIEVGKIIGLHNGSIPSFAPSKEDEDTRSDSRTLIEKVDRLGIVDAVKSAGQGAYALVYVNKENQTVNFVRNFQRPLHYMWNSDETTMYWASEIGMLLWLKERVGEGSFGEPRRFEIAKQYTINIKTMELRTEDIYPPVIYHSSSVPQIRQIKPQPLYCYTCKKEKKDCSCSSNHAVVLVPDDKLKVTWYWGWEKKAIRSDQVIDILRYGCSCCSVSQALHNEVMWVSPHKIICSSCLKDRQTFQYISASFDRMYPGRIIAGSTASNYGTRH